MIGENFAMRGCNEEEWANKPVLNAPSILSISNPHCITTISILKILRIIIIYQIYFMYNHIALYWHIPLWNPEQ